MKDVMLDFETFGNGRDACVVQVGAAYFHPITGEVGSIFKRNVCAISAVRSGAVIDPGTMYWWMGQGKMAQESVIAEPRFTIEEVFSELNHFLDGAENIWSHATFDFPILMETFKRLKMKPGFSFRAAKDIRTLMWLAELPPDQASPVRSGTHHDALDDVIYQIKYCVNAIRKIKSVGVQT